MSRLSVVRRFALWLFGDPAIPYVSTNIVVDFTNAQTFLARVNAGGGTPRITVQHLVTATVGRLYREFPQANGRVVGHRIEHFDQVSVAAPVDLIDHDVGRPMELGMAIVSQVDRMSLAEVATQTTRLVREERSGRPTHPLVRLGLPVAERMPDFAFDLFLTASGRVARSRFAAPLRRYFEVSAVVTNPGATFRDLEGGRFMGGAMAPPTRLIPLGSVFGLSAVQPEVFVVDGRPEARVGLPVVYIFDHRLFDGVMCSRILRRFTEMLQDPAELFGEDGSR